MEPEEGKYAWIYDENYKKLIQGALDRGLSYVSVSMTTDRTTSAKVLPNMSVPQELKDIL